MFVWKSSLDRDPQVMCKNMLVAGRVLRRAHPLVIMTIDRDHPPGPAYLSKLCCATGQFGQPLLPPCRVVLYFTWAVNHQRVGGEGPGEVSARTEMVALAIFAVRSSGRVDGLRTARIARTKFEFRISCPDLYVLRTGRVVGHNIARFHRPLTCTAPLPGKHASSALASPSQRVCRESARAAAGSKVVCTPEKKPP